MPRTQSEFYDYFECGFLTLLHHVLAPRVLNYTRGFSLYRKNTIANDFKYLTGFFYFSINSEQSIQ